MTPSTPTVPPGMVQQVWPTRLYPPRRTQAPPAPSSRAPRTPRWELSIVPPRLTIYPNRVGTDLDLPLTRLPLHKSLDYSLSVSVFHVTSLIFYAT
jgi:hypothetical protein